MVKVFSLLFFGVGVFILVQVIMPVISYKIWEISLSNQNLTLLTSDPNQSDVLGVSLENTDNFPAFVSNIKRDYPVFYNEFRVTVPSINLVRAKVKIDSNSFEENLAHLPGSALPGEKGNVFITGHSSFPQFFREGNYKAIFAKLPDVKIGDEILVEAGGQKFTYIIEKLNVVKPTETWVINPPDLDGRYLSLMTCVPPGFYFKRLVVLARLK